MGTLSTHGTVYIARRERDGAIKIGVTDKSPRFRVDELRYLHKSPMALLVAFNGGRRFERVLHERFAVDAVPGENEWFRPSLALIAYIDSAVRGVEAARCPTQPVAHYRCRTATVHCDGRA